MSLFYGDKCIKCGKKTEHRSMKCLACRKKSCEKCGVKFAPLRNSLDKLCSSCKKHNYKKKPIADSLIYF